MSAEADDLAVAVISVMGGSSAEAVGQCAACERQLPHPKAETRLRATNCRVTGLHD